MPASARAYSTPRTSPHRRRTPAGPGKRRAGSAVLALNRGASQRARQPDGRRDRPDGGACPGSLPPARTEPTARSEPRSAAPPATALPRGPTRSPAPVRTVQRSTQCSRDRRAGRATSDLRGRGSRTCISDRGRRERPGTGTELWRQPDSRNRPSAGRTDRPPAGPACEPTPPTARPRSWSDARGVLRAGQAGRRYRPRNPLLDDHRGTWRPHLSGS